MTRYNLFFFPSLRDYNGSTYLDTIKVFKLNHKNTMFFSFHRGMNWKTPATHHKVCTAVFQLLPQWKEKILKWIFNTVSTALWDIFYFCTPKIQTQCHWSVDRYDVIFGDLFPWCFSYCSGLFNETHFHSVQGSAGQGWTVCSPRWPGFGHWSWGWWWPSQPALGGGAGSVQSHQGVQPRLHPL